METQKMIDQFIGVYCAKERCYSDHTALAYSVALHQFQDYLKEHKLLPDITVEGDAKKEYTYQHLQQLKAKDIRPFMGWLHERHGLGRNSIRQKVVAVKSFFK